MPPRPSPNPSTSRAVRGTAPRIARGLRAPLTPPQRHHAELWEGPARHNAKLWCGPALRNAKLWCGFSLIEMLVAMTVLVVLMTVLVFIFNDSERIWGQETGAAELRADARHALNVLTHELRNTIADSNNTFAVDVDETYLYDYQGSRLSFVAMGGDATNGVRAVRETVVWAQSVTNQGYARGQLLLGRRLLDDTTPGYDTPTWYDETSGRGPPADPGLLLDNVTAFVVTAPGSEHDYTSTTHSNRPPAYVDLLIELVPETVARQLDDMQRRGLDAAQINGRLEQKAQRVATRVFIPNREAIY